MINQEFFDTVVDFYKTHPNIKIATSQFVDNYNTDSIRKCCPLAAALWQRGFLDEYLNQIVDLNRKDWSLFAAEKFSLPREFLKAMYLSFDTGYPFEGNDGADTGLALRSHFEKEGKLNVRSYDL